MRGDHSVRTRWFRRRQLACGLTRGALMVMLLAVHVPSAVAADARALTERQAVDLALSRTEYRALEEGRLGIARSAVTEASLWPNPVLAWERDRVSASTESTAKIFQSFDFSGRRALRREAANIRVDAAQFDQQDRRLNTIVEVRRLFSESLYRQELGGAYARWLRRIETATEIVGKLAKAGEASGYDRRRIEREAQTARARVASVAAEYARMREAMSGLIGESAGQLAALGGELLPGNAPSLEALQSALRQRPDFASLNAQADANDRERSAAERAWIPDVTVGVGQKRVDEFSRTDTGVILALSVPLPLFDRGQGSQQRAQARASTLRAEQALAYARAGGELKGAWRQAAELRQAAASFRSESLGGSRDLTRIAEAAYRAGEGTILELLDAYRTDLEAETTTLDLELRARLARIELDVLSGAKPYE